jgi:hypothetical protein
VSPGAAPARPGDGATPAVGRRAVQAGILALAAGGCAATTPAGGDDRAAIDGLGTFEHLPGRAAFVVAAPHGTADTGSLALARDIRARTGASGVFVTGFWDGPTRTRINVNRDTEQIMGANSQVVRQVYSARAARANARYTTLVREAAQGPLRWFFEIHSNSDPRHAGSVEISTLGLTADNARRFKAAFVGARDRRVPADAPRLDIHVAPADTVTYSLRGASSISDHCERGFLIESPSRVLREARWRAAYARVLAEVIASTVG